MIVDELHDALDELAGPPPSPSREQVATLLRAATRARRRRRGAVVVLSAIALAAAVSAGLLVRSESSPPIVRPAQVPTTSGAIQTPEASATVTVVGDTVTVGASQELETAIEDRFDGRATVAIHTTDGMGASGVLRVLRTARDQGTLGRTVVLQFGTNGPIDSKTLSDILTLTDRVANVVVVNDKVPRDWESSNNRMLADAVAQHDNALLVDWYAFGTARPELFYDDGIHLTPTGAHRYAAQVAEAINTTSTPTSRARREIPPPPEAQDQFGSSQWVGTLSRNGQVVGYVPGPANPNRNPGVSGVEAVYRNPDGSGGIVGYTTEAGFIDKTTFDSPGFDLATEVQRSRAEIEIAARETDPSFNLAEAERRVYCQAFEDAGMPCPDPTTTP